MSTIYCVFKTGLHNIVVYRKQFHIVYIKRERGVYFGDFIIDLYQTGKNQPKWKTTSNIFVNGRRPQISFEMEDDLKYSCKWKTKCQRWNMFSD